MKIYKVIILLLLVSVGSQTIAQKNDKAQKMATTESSFQKQYDRNIKKSRINGVYIPASLEEAYEELSALSEASGIEKFKQAPEDIIARKLHFGLGRWISVNWNLEEGSRYEYFLKELGLANVDDMIQFTIISWHRHLLGKEQDTAARIKVYQEKLAAKLAERREKSELISKETRSIKK